jgi:hypothetical protein
MLMLGHKRRGYCYLANAAWIPGLIRCQPFLPTVAECTNDQGGNADLRSSEERGQESDLLRIMVWWSTRAKR